MAKKPQGRNAKSGSIAPYVSQLKKLEPNKQGNIEAYLKPNKASTVKLDALISTKSLPSRLAKFPLQNYGEEFQKLHGQIVAEMDCSIVAQLVSAGHLGSLLMPDGVSIGWMFSSDEELQEEGL